MTADTLTPSQELTPNPTQTHSLPARVGGEDLHAMSLDVSLYDDEEQCLYDANITHNLNTMAGEAGIYEHLWRPDEIGVTKASQLIEPLRAGLAQLVERPTHFEQFNSPNGWGLYVHFVPFVARYLEACIANPDANVRTCR